MKPRLTGGKQEMKQASKRERRIRNDLKLIRGNIKKEHQLYVNGKPLQFEVVRNSKPDSTDSEENQ